MVKDLVPGSCRVRPTRTDPCCESLSIKASRLVIISVLFRFRREAPEAAGELKRTVRGEDHDDGAHL